MSKLSLPGAPTTMHLGGKRLSLMLAAVLVACAVAGGWFAAGRLSGSRGMLGSRPAAQGGDGQTGSEVRDIASQVAALRGLGWKRPPDIKVVPESELVARYARASARQLDPVRMGHQEAMYRLLHLIPPDLDYAKTLEGLMESGVRGFYDSQTREVFVGAPATGQLPPDARVAIAHELDHALTDQHFNFGARQDALDSADAEDQSLALSSLVEGDAVLLQDRWMARYLSDAEQVVAVLGGESSGSEPAEPVPSFLQDESLFPYTAGLTFVRHLVELGGLAAIDRAYRDPPRSSEQILHPDLYLQKPQPAPTQPPSPPPHSGCQAVRSGTLGPFLMSEILREQVSPSDADGAVQGWTQDAYAVVHCPGGLRMMERWQADGQDNASRLAAALSRWAKGWSGSMTVPRVVGPGVGFSGPSGSGSLSVQGEEVLLVLADAGRALDELAGWG